MAVSRSDSNMTYVVPACIVMVHIVMVLIVVAAYIVMGYIVMSCCGKVIRRQHATMTAVEMAVAVARSLGNLGQTI